MHDTVTEYEAIDADHFGDGQRGSNLHRGDTGLLQFGGDRSAAARAGSSRRGEDDRIDRQSFCLLRHLPPHPARVG